MPDTYLGFAALVMTLACLSIMGRFMQASRRKEPMRAMFYKGLASLCFLAVGLLGLLPETEGDCRPAEMLRGIRGDVSRPIQLTVNRK